MVSRSNSFIGTIKSILPANLPWFGAGSDQPDTPSKRKQVEERQDVEEGTRSSKRQRKASPLGELGEMGQAASRGQPQVSLPQTAYLDPPQRAFSQSAVGKALRPSPMHARASSVAVPSRSTRTPGISLGLGVARGRSIGFGRTKSMDPPDRLRSVSYRPALSPMPISRDVSMEDLSFEDTPSSPSQPFRMRTSLTPQIPDLDIGLMGRKEREVSEPPPVSDLVDKPAFIRAPPDAPRQATPLTRSESLTLGAVAEAHKQAKPLQRSHSSLVIGSGEGATQDGQSTSQPAEKALRELDVYKTPLLPTRLRGSNTVPEMFRAKRGKAPVLMHDRHDKPRLGTGDKNGVLAKVEESPSTKPYAGRGGTKKLLEKRRLEEEQEQERAKAAFMDDEIEEGTRKTANELDSQLIAELRPIATAKEPESPTPVTTIGGREQPSLRVGRARVSRNHITRPMMHGRPGRFSAIEEEEEDDLMGEGAQKKAPRYTNAPPMLPSFQPPAGFSFAKDTAGPKVDDPNAKEAPIASLPFSLAMSSTASSSAGPSSKVEKPSSTSLPSESSKPTAATTPPATVAASSNTVSASASPTPLFPSVPQVAVTPATPKAGESGSETSKTSPSVPNFFASSAFLSKPLGSPGSPTPSFNLTGSSEGVKAASSFFAPLNDKKAEQPSIFAKPAASTDDIFSPHNKENSATSAPGAASTEPSQPPFGAPATTAPVSAFPAFGVPASTSVSQPPKEKETVIAPTPKPATAAAAPSPFAFGTPSKPAEKPPAAPSLPFAFGTPTKSTETAVASPTPSPAPFAFGTPTKLTEHAAGSPSPSPAPFAFSTPTKSNAPAAPSTPFAFGAPTQAEAPKSDAGSRPQTAEAPKSLFGTAPAAPQSPSPFTFGTPTKTEAPKSDAGSRPVTAEAPKSLFNLVPVAPQPVTPLRGFSPAAPSTPEPVKAPFIFGQPVTPGPASAPSTPAPPEVPKSMFGAAGAGGFTFGQPSTNSAASTPTKPPFAFGAAPATPTNENKPFTFGTPTTQAAPTAFSTPTAAADTSKPFTFGAPSTPAREATPPKREDSEVMMDESPARPPTELGKPELPKINASGFSFNIAGAASSPFSSPQTTNGFSFTQPPASSALFGTKPEAKPAEKSGGTFTFGQSTTGNTGFAFGSQKPVETNTAAPAPTFTFNTPTPTPTAPSAPFGFGAPQISQSTSFGSNAPASPFGQPTGNGFAFGSGTTPTSTTSPFTFSGSQPASPATTNVGLPAQNGGGGFTFGASSTVAPAAASSPFAAPAPLPEAGGALFTMGAAPPAGSRQMKALPKRRPGKR